MLTEEEVVLVREEHSGYMGLCRMCGTFLPCRVTRLLEERDQAIQRIDEVCAEHNRDLIEMERLLEQAQTERDKAVAEIDRQDALLRELAFRAREVLTEIPKCRCHRDYTIRGRDDPDCPYHQIGRGGQEIEALREVLDRPEVAALREMEGE